MLRQLGLASLVSGTFAASALAADLPPRAAPPLIPMAPAFTWSGFYIGTHTGAISLNGDIRTNGNAANTIANVTANRRPAVLSTDDDFTMMSGIQAGYNVQFGSIVLGVEGDISHAGVKARDVFFSTLNDPSFFRQELHTFGTARARVGLAFDQVLVYATGGLAGASFTDRVAFLRNTDNAFQFVGRRSTTEYGYTVGGGVEFSLPESLRQFAFIGNLLNASAVTVRAEYLYFDLGDRNVLVNAVPGAGLNSYTTRFESTGHIGRIGFNYRFGT